MAEVKRSETTRRTGSGKEIDAPAAAALAVEEEHGYDLAEAKRRRSSGVRSSGGKAHRRG